MTFSVSLYPWVTLRESTTSWPVSLAAHVCPTSDRGDPALDGGLGNVLFSTYVRSVSCAGKRKFPSWQL